MKHRRNLGVVAVTAAVVTTALVGTTLPDLMADRASDSVQQQQEGSSAESVVTTDLPDVPSAKEISDAKGSSQATDQMITEINERLSQANQRALELEASLQMEHQDALAAEEEAREAARAAEEAEKAAETADSAAADEYREGETSAEDVLLSEDDDALAEAASEDQLNQQAQDQADTAKQDADEAEALQDAADAAARQNSQAQDSLDTSEEATATSFSELGETVRDLLAAGATTENVDDLRAYYALTLGNPDLVDEDGEVDTEALGSHIATLNEDATETPSAESSTAENETADGSTEGDEGEASPSVEPEAEEEPASDEADGEADVAVAQERSEDDSESDEEESTSGEDEAAAEEAASGDAETAAAEERSGDQTPSDEAQATTDEDASQDQATPGPSHSLSQYLPSTRALVEQLAELEDESITETFQRLTDDAAFTTDSGILDHSAVNAEVNRLAPSPSPSSESSSESSSSPEPSASPSPSTSPSPSQSSQATESEESSGSSESASAHSLSDYQSSTAGLVERIAELNEESASGAFKRLVSDSDFTDSNGHLDHAALQREVNRLAPSPSPSPSQSSGGDSGSSGNSESSNSGNSESSSSESSSGPSHSLGQYREGTRSLVEQIAELNSDGVSATFDRLAGSSDFTDSSGVLNHSALQSEVNRLSPSQESSSSSGGSSSDSDSNSNQGSGSNSGSQDVSAGAGSGAAQIAADWAVARVNEPGTHYVLGGNGPMAWDCSSLMQQSFAQAGVSLPRTADQQFQGGTSVSLDELQVGDIVFWTSGGRATHNAIYIGDGQIAHARNPQAGLSVTSVFYAFEDPHPVAKRYF